MSLEIKARELALEREQKQWRHEKIELKRDIQLLEAEKKALQKLVNPKKVRIEGLNRAMRSLQLAINNLAEQRDGLETELDGLNTHNMDMLEQFHELKAKVEVLKSRIDAKLDKYEARAKKAIDMRLESLSGQIIKLESALELKKQSFESAGIALAEIESETAKAKKTHKVAVDSMAGEATELEAKLKPLKDQVSRLEADIAGLEGQKADLSRENLELFKDNEAFKAYEAKAMKALASKDEELQGREKALREKEQFVATRQSFLPPR